MPLAKNNIKCYRKNQHEYKKYCKDSNQSPHWNDTITAYKQTNSTIKQHDQSALKTAHYKKYLKITSLMKAKVITVYIVSYEKKNK